MSPDPNSPPLMTLIGTLVAAFAGTYGAYLIIERNKKKTDMLQELRNTNSAISVSFEICNSLISLKDQHVLRLGQNYDRTRKNFHNFNANHQKGDLKKGKILEIHADFESLDPIHVPSDVLSKQVFEKISANARIHILTNTLMRTIDSLNKSISRRNEIIDNWKMKMNNDTSKFFQYYFGLPNSNGHVDQTYPDTVSAILSLTDDSIFFSRLLCEDLGKHGEKLKRTLGKKAPSISKIDFSKAAEKGLMPNPENYQDWHELS